ncbi:MAG: glycogen synthase GlgA [Ruminococcaceae bacterium]|nr:glycogen synthase GlgA [Oscillospiraceae bacterium]
MKVLYAASEAYPFAMSGGLADVAGALPKALRRRLIGCRVVMPLYDTISEELKANMNFITGITVPVAWRRQYCGIFEAKVNGIIYYLLDNQYYFKRDALYGFYDDAERYAFFSRAVIEMISYIDYKPDIIHCNDWQTALIPVFLNALYRENPEHSNIHTVLTIHNIQYQGKYGHELIGDVLGLPDGTTQVIDYDNCVNFMKGGIQEADRVTTVSPTYAKEILDPYYAHGLDGILNQLRDKVSGIVNGIDVEVYNPETDKFIYENYSKETIDKKTVNKTELQKELSLPVREDVPVIGIVTRLVKHKGLDLVKHVFEDMLKADVQFAILGSGEWEFETFFHEMANKYPEKVAFKMGFIPALARKIYAGADIFLMPSQSEPCGLAQMVALRYGTIPIVRETGGLADTISDSGDNMGNGFTFKSYNAHDMLETVWRALQGYSDKQGWKALKIRAMECDNSWGKSANEYIKLYKQILGK